MWVRVKCCGSIYFDDLGLFLQYACCMEPTVGGDLLQIWPFTSLSKYLLMIEVRATGHQSFRHGILFLDTGTLVDNLKLQGTKVERDRLKISTNTPASCVVHVLSTRPNTPSGLGALHVLTCLNVLCTAATLSAVALDVLM